MACSAPVDEPGAVRNLLLDLVEYLFETDDAQNLMTIGLLIDILRDVIYADEDSALEAIFWHSPVLPCA